MKTASTNSPWAYIWEGLLSEGYLRLRFGGLIFGRAYFFLGGGGLIIGILRYVSEMMVKIQCWLVWGHAVREILKFSLAVSINENQ